MSEIIKVLLVEDNPGDARLVEEVLSQCKGQFCSEKTFDLVHVNRLEKATDYLEQFNVDIILLDLTLPDSSGFQTFLTMRDKYPATPIVVLTGNEDENQAFEAFGEGVQTYLIKDRIEPKILSRCLNYALEKFDLINELDKHK
jgi:CheY-like chemotaxis protein